MNWLRSIGWQRGSLWLIACAILVFGAVRLFAAEPEIALIPGEPWEDMRQRSSAAIDPAIPGEIWARLPKSDARLRLIDPQYGFITPPARFFMVSFKNERVENVSLSPQIEPLLLDDTLKVVLTRPLIGKVGTGGRHGTKSKVALSDLQPFTFFWTKPL